MPPRQTLETCKPAWLTARTHAAQACLLNLVPPKRDRLHAMAHAAFHRFGHAPVGRRDLIQREPCFICHANLPVSVRMSYAGAVANWRNLGNIDPAPLAPRSHSQFRQLHAARAVKKVMRKGRVLRNVAQKHLPLHLERVVEFGVVGNHGPRTAKLNRIGQIGIPNRPRRVGSILELALAQSRYGAPRGAVHLQVQKFVAIHARGPRRVDLRYDPALKLEYAVRRVIGGACVTRTQPRQRARECA